MNKTQEYAYGEAYKQGWDDALKHCEQSIAIIKEWNDSPEFPLMLALQKYINTKIEIHK